MEKIILLLLVSCSTITQDLDPLVYYKRDMQIEVNGHKAIGTVVVPKTNKYKLKLKFKGKGDMVLIKTCHREEELFKLGRHENLYFYPNAEMEDQGSCFLEIAALEYKKGRHTFAMVDFQSPIFNLSATMKCSGKTYNSPGVTLCQSKEGLIQKITFPEPVTPAKTGSCGALPQLNETTFKYKTPNRVCTFLFMGKSGKFHKLTTVGYERVIVREMK